MLYVHTLCFPNTHIYSPYTISYHEHEHVSLEFFSASVQLTPHSLHNTPRSKFVTLVLSYLPNVSLRFSLQPKKPLTLPSPILSTSTWKKVRISTYPCPIPSLYTHTQLLNSQFHPSSVMQHNIRKTLLEENCKKKIACNLICTPASQRN